MTKTDEDGGQPQSTEQVYAHVRNAILDGEFVAGSAMSQVSLANELGISRTPLREALRVLQGEGLISSEPGRRVRVAAVTPEDLEELCIIRVTLEAQALRLAVPRLGSEDLARLEGYIGEMSHYAAVKDYRRWVMPHRAFHRQLTAPAGERVNDLLGQLFDHGERYRRLHIGHGPGAWAVAGHRGILDACKSGERERAATLLASHLARTAFEAAELLRPGYENAQLRRTLADIGADAPVPDGERC
jgi:GntR family transcriptional regulator, rspAB operon transcriptional repressor